jgi:hypothetical protein
LRSPEELGWVLVTDFATGCSPPHNCPPAETLSSDRLAPPTFMGIDQPAFLAIFSVINAALPFDDRLLDGFPTRVASAAAALSSERGREYYSAVYALN